MHHPLYYQHLIFSISRAGSSIHFHKINQRLSLPKSPDHNIYHHDTMYSLINRTNINIRLKSKIHGTSTYSWNQSTKPAPRNICLYSRRHRLHRRRLQHNPQQPRKQTQLNLSMPSQTKNSAPMRSIFYAKTGILPLDIGFTNWGRPSGGPRHYSSWANTKSPRTGMALRTEEYPRGSGTVGG